MIGFPLGFTDVFADQGNLILGPLKMADVDRIVVAMRTGYRIHQHDVFIFGNTHVQGDSAG